MARSRREPDAARRERRAVPFVLHEVAEYLVGAALVVVGFHVTGALEYLLVATGASLVALGALSAGRLGAFSLLSRRAHHAADVVLAALLALSPVAFFSDLKVSGTLVAEGVALALLRIERGTRYVDPERRPRTAAGPAGRDEDLRQEAALRESPASAAEAAGAAAGAIAAQLAPAAGRAAKAGARGLGVVAGMTRRAARERASRRGASRT